MEDLLDMEANGGAVHDDFEGSDFGGEADSGEHGDSSADNRSVS